MQVRFIENVYFLFDPSMWNKEISFIFYNSYVYVCQDSQSANFEKYFVQLIHLNLNFSDKVTPLLARLNQWL